MRRRCVQCREYFPVKPRSRRQTCSALCYSGWRASLSDSEIAASTSRGKGGRPQDPLADFACAEMDDLLTSLSERY